MKQYTDKIIISLSYDKKVDYLSVFINYYK